MTPPEHATAPLPLAIGYPVDPFGVESLVDIAADYAGRIAEVYFAWPGWASGRSALPGESGAAEALTERIEADLPALRRLGVKLDLLLNANCYGPEAAGRNLERRIGDLLERISSRCGPVDVVTTTSPAVADMVRRRAPEVELRASVNMRIGTPEGMGYLADRFDSYYVQRDYNRDPDRLKRLHDWAGEHGKGLCLLANSGCLRFCSGQTFHDNIVAHHRQIDPDDLVEGFSPYLCRRVLAERDNWPVLLRATWVRPEDLHHYRGRVDLVKLATRTHVAPRMVVDAYVRERFHGNLLDLLEPGYAPLLAPRWIDNDAFPPDWFERTTQCAQACETCPYCREVLGRVLKTFGEAT